MKILSLLGRSGAGKGTQAKILAEKSGFQVINTGDLLRQRAKENDIIGRNLKYGGGLVPTPVVFSLWLPCLIRHYESSAKGVIFDGNPRKLYEAHMLDELFSMLGWKDFCACYIDISKEEAKRRLKERGRIDDTEKGIEERLSWFDHEVMPVVEYYRQKGILEEINGDRRVEEIADDIEEKLSNFLYD